MEKKNWAAIKMDILFKATDFKLNKNQSPQDVKLTFGSINPTFTLEALLNPKPLSAAMVINEEEQIPP